MTILLWSIGFICLIGATITGIGALIKALSGGWYIVTIIFLLGAFIAAECADKSEDEG